MLVLSRDSHHIGCWCPFLDINILVLSLRENPSRSGFAIGIFTRFKGQIISVEELSFFTQEKIQWSEERRPLLENPSLLP